jgi:hypothetical protein
MCGKEFYSVLCFDAQVSTVVVLVVSLSLCGASLETAIILSTVQTCWWWLLHTQENLSYV